MTPQEAKKKLKARLECLKRDTSGTDIDCNYRNCDECNLCYEQGNMGEQKEALDMAIKALEQIRWIPVSERLPEEFQCVLVTTGSRVDVCTYLKGSAYWKSYVLAWIPLPQPYKAESEDKK